MFVSAGRLKSNYRVLHMLVATGIALVIAHGARADTKGSLPAGVDNLKLTKPITMYSPSTLESLLDGEAEAIRRYDFKECAHGEYGPNGSGNQLMTADIFLVGSPAAAYGLYSGQRSPRATFLKIGAEGYKEDTALNFWKGPYYVRIAITATNKAAFQASMPKLAAAIANKLTGTTAVPAIVSTLPAGYTPKSEQYRLADIAAQSYIRNGMVAKYPTAGQQAEMFVAQFPNAAAATDSYGKYSTYLTKPSNVAMGAKIAQLPGYGQKAMTVKTKFTGVVIAAVQGKTLVGIRYIADNPKQQSVALALVKAAIAKAK